MAPRVGPSAMPVKSRPRKRENVRELWFWLVSKRATLVGVRAHRAAGSVVSDRYACIAATPDVMPSRDQVQV